MEQSDMKQQRLISQENSTKKTLTNNVVSKRKEITTIIFLLVVRLLGIAVDSLPIPFFPTAAKHRGIGETQVGIIFAAYDLAKFAASPFSSMIVLKLTPRRAFLLSGLFSGLICILYGFVGYTEHQVLFVFCLVLRLAAGFASSVLSIAVAAIILKSQNFTTATIIGWYDMSLGLGYMAGAMLGGVIYKFVGYLFTFVIFGGTLAVATIPAWIIMPNIVDVNNDDDKGFMQLIRIPGVLMMFIGTTTFEFCIIGSLAMMSGWLITSFDMSVSSVSLMYAGMFLAYIIFNPVAAWLTNKGAVYIQIIIAFGVASLCMLFITPSPILSSLLPDTRPLWLVVVIAVIFDITQPFAYITTYQAGLDSAILAGHDKDSVRTYAMLTAVQECCVSLGAMIGSTVSGAVTEHLSYEWFETICSFLLAAMMMMFTGYYIIMSLKGSPLRPPKELDPPHQKLHDEISE